MMEAKRRYISEKPIAKIFSDVGAEEKEENENTEGKEISADGVDVIIPDKITGTIINDSVAVTVDEGPAD